MQIILTTGIFRIIFKRKFTQSTFEVSMLARSVLLFFITFFTINFSAKAVDTALQDIPSGKYEVDLTHASIVWKVSHFGFSNYVGRFNDFSAEIDLNTGNFSKSSVVVDIKVASIDTAFPYPEQEDFDKKLSEGWFNSAEAPSMTFKSTKVSELNGNEFTIQGELTMAGQTHPVTLNAVLNGGTPSHPFKKKPLIGFSATTIIDRTVWGVDKYAPKVGAEVEVEIEGEFVKAD